MSSSGPGAGAALRYRGRGPDSAPPLALEVVGGRSGARGGVDLGIHGLVPAHPAGGVPHGGRNPGGADFPDAFRHVGEAPAVDVEARNAVLLLQFVGDVAGRARAVDDIELGAMHAAQIVIRAIAGEVGDDLDAELVPTPKPQNPKTPKPQIHN